MHIVIDGRMAHWTGIGRYTKKLIELIPKLDPENHYTALLLEADVKTWQPSGPNLRLVTTKIQPYSMGEQFALPQVLSRLNPDLVHFPHFSAPFSYSKPHIVTVHDLTLRHWRNIRGEGFIARTKYNAKFQAMQFVMKQVISNSRIITDTEYVKQDIIQTFFGGTLPDSSKITTIPLGFDGLTNSSAEPVSGLLPTDEFILHVGNFYPHKNLASLIKTMKKLADTRPQLRLVLAGKVDYFQKDLVALADKLGVRERVIFPGFTSDTELAWLYQHAQAFVLPSLSEGFGLPGLEAMTNGLPVIAADTTCLPEVYGDAATYFDPTSVSDMTRVIDETLGNKKLLDDLKKRGFKQLKQYSWEACAKQTLEVYREFQR
jgi:glycosyltransferase involved in cell wall biosynthesis